jgi:hypothetical protein
MQASVRRRLPAALCALAIPAGGLLIRPYVEMGLGDDWSYIHTAKLFAETGHFVYNGWGSPMLGWQVVLAAPFIKLFGFSFTSVRVSTLLIAMVTAFLLQRTFVRAGLNQTNAVLGTLALLFSPLVVPLIFSFMTDIPGLFCIVLCLYACLRAVQAESSRAALAWIVFAALSNAVGGTVRQIIWLGVLVMVPSALWLLRRNRTILLYGAIAYAVSVAFIEAATRWFKRQPYTIPFDSVIPVSLTVHNLRAYAPSISWNLRTVAPLLPFYLFPVLFLFLPALYRSHRRALACIVAAGVLAMLCGPWLHQPPFDLFLIVITAAATVACLLCVFFARGRATLSPAARVPLSWYQLWVLIGPFTLAYVAVILPRAFFVIFDRYLIPLMLIAVLVLLRYAQDRISPRLPLVCVLPIALFGAYAVAKTHDVFSLFRGRLALIEAYPPMRSTACFPTTAGFRSSAPASSTMPDFPERRRRPPAPPSLPPSAAGH